MNNMKKITFFAAIALCLTIMAGISKIPIINATEVSSPDFPAGILRVSNEETKELPLAHTKVNANVVGYVADVEVRQEYVNPYAEPIEAIYIFPLPHNAAVYDMEMRIGDRIIRADIKKREEARQIYEQAKQQGRRTSLLEQERPNIFTQS